MSKTVQLKRGNANVSASYVGAVGEITVNTTDYTLNIHDGVTPGGYVVTGINGGNIGNISLNDQTISGLNSNADITLDSGSANLDIQGNTVVTGNITADYYIGNGTLLTGLYSNADVVSLLNNFGNPISTTSNVTAAYFVGNGSNLTGVNVTTFANVRVNNQTIFSINEPTQALVVGRGDGLGNVLIQGNVFAYDATIQTARLGNVFANGSIVSLGNISVNVVTGGRFVGDVVTLRYSNVVTGFCFTSNDQQFLTNTGLLHREQSSANPNVSVLALSHDQPVAYFYSNTTTEMVGNLVITTSNKPHGNFANAFVAVYSNVNSYSQLIKQNTNEGTEASSDFVATANNGTDTTFYVDLGIAGNLHADSEFFGDTTSFNDAYLYVTGYDEAGPSTGNIGNLIIGSTNGIVKTFIGNTAEANVVTVVTSTGLLPGANVVYSLGSATRQWKDLWVSNNTIYLGGVSLSVSADGNLLVNGNTVSGGGNANVSLGNFVFSANSLLNFNGGNYTNGDLSHGHTAAVILPLNGSNNPIQILNTYSNVTISSGSNSSITGTWSFDNSGRLLLPTSGKIVGVTANNNGYLTWEGSSSGDGLGFTTMTLVPDDTVSSQVLVLDPTAPGHIHLRVPGIGGNIEQPAANIFLGSETTSFEITAQYGVAPEARIHSGNNTWTFGNGGNLLLPRDAVGNTDPYLWITGGPAPTISSIDVSLAGPANLQIVSDYLNLSGYTGAKVAIKADNGEIATDANMVLTTNNANVGNTYSWTFGNDGSLSTPGNITGANVVSANTFVSTAFNVVTAGNLSITSQYGLGFTGTILEDNGTLELIANGGGSVYVGWDSLYGNGLGNIATVSFNEVGGGEGNILLRTGNRSATEYNWVFGNDGSLSTPGNVTVNDTLFIVGSIQPIGASPAPSLSGFSSISTVISGNPNEGNITAHNYLIANGGIITSGNITANYVIGNGSELTSVNAATVDILNTNGLGTTFYPTFVENRTNGQILRADVDLSYRTDTNTFTVNNISSSGNITGNTGGFAIGYRDVPQVVFTSNATLALTDAGKHYFSSNSANVITVPNNATVTFNIGTAISIIQQGTANLTITPAGGVTMYLAGNSTSASRTLGNYGMATLMKVGTDTWFINGTGLN